MTCFKLLVRLSGLLALFFVSFNLAGCKEDSGAGENCLKIDRVNSTEIAPAGVRVSFRVLDCADEPVRQLTSSDIDIVNDEKGELFGAGGEGGGVSDLGEPSDLGLYSVLALDMSDSIFNNDAVDSVVDGAKVFVQKLVTEPSDNLKHQVAILAFGSGSNTEWVTDFTNDDASLNETLENLRDAESKGGTDLYGSYMELLDKIDDAGQGEDLVEKFAVILTDGTHEAGDEEGMRASAMSKKESSDASIFSIGIKGEYDESKIKELASQESYFTMADSAGQLGGVFEEVAQKAAARAKSNYVVGVCTPVEMGSPSLTINIEVDGLKGSETVSYSTNDLTGDVAECDAETIADPCNNIDCGPGVLPGFDCGTCSGATEWCNAGSCEDDCAGLECGDSPVEGYSCGTCSGTTPYCIDNLCSDSHPCEPNCPTWISIPGGTFDMGSTSGSSNETPVHSVTVPSFEMTQSEVTVAQYGECVTEGSCTAPSTSSSYCNWGESGYEDHPVNCVDWQQSVDFCAWVGGRLPSESEWEYAASNGASENIYPWGDEEATCDYAVMDDSTHSDGCDTGRTWSVCSKTAGNTSHGLCDMAGNVWERVEDWYHSDYTGAPADGSAWVVPSGSYRVTRGGGFSISAVSLRAADRNYYAPSYQYDFLGFRCAR